MMKLVYTVNVNFKSEHNILGDSQVTLFHVVFGKPHKTSCDR